MASPQNNVYTHSKKSRNEQSRRRDDDRRPVDVDDVDDHPLVTEMFGELYFRESPNSSLDALFAAIDSRAAAAAVLAKPASAAAVRAKPAAVAEESAAPVEVNAPPQGGGGSGDNGDGDDHTPEQASSAN